MTNSHKQLATHHGGPQFDDAEITVLTTEFTALHFDLINRDEFIPDSGEGREKLGRILFNSNLIQFIDGEAPQVDGARLCAVLDYLAAQDPEESDLLAPHANDEFDFIAKAHSTCVAALLLCESGYIDVTKEAQNRLVENAKNIMDGIIDRGKRNGLITFDNCCEQIKRGNEFSVASLLHPEENHDFIKHSELGFIFAGDGVSNPPSPTIARDLFEILETQLSRLKNEIKLQGWDIFETDGDSWFVLQLNRIMLETNKQLHAKYPPTLFDYHGTRFETAKQSTTASIVLTIRKGSETRLFNINFGDCKAILVDAQTGNQTWLTPIISTYPNSLNKRNQALAPMQGAFRCQSSGSIFKQEFTVEEVKHLIQIGGLENQQDPGYVLPFVPLKKNQALQAPFTVTKASIEETKRMFLKLGTDGLWDNLGTCAKNDESYRVFDSIFKKMMLKGKSEKAGLAATGIALLHTVLEDIDPAHRYVVCKPDDISSISVDVNKATPFFTYEAIPED